MSKKSTVAWDFLSPEERREINAFVRQTAQLKLLRENTLSPDQKQSQQQKKNTKPEE